MVHISDGVLAPEVWIAGYMVTGVLLAWTLRKMRAYDIPRLSIITAAVFVASLIHIPIGPTSAHFVLNGFAGVMLGIFSYPSIFIALTLQALLFQHGGITTIGINTVNMGVPALVAHGIFKLGSTTKIQRKEELFGAFAGGAAVFLAVVLLSVALLTTGREFEKVVMLIAAAHVPIILIEAIAVGSIIAFLKKVKPEIIGVKA